MTLAIVISVFTISLMRSPTAACIYLRKSKPLNRDSRYYDAAFAVHSPQRHETADVAVISPAHSRFEEIRRERRLAAHDHACKCVASLVHKGEIDISFSAGQDSETEVVRAESRDVFAQRRITIWLAMTAARFAFRPAKGDVARIELYGLIQPACSPVRSRRGKCKGTRGTTR